MIENITPVKPGSVIEVKRLYFPGLKVFAKCPECGDAAVRDFGDNYLSYPEVGTPIKVYFSCQNRHEWIELVMLSVSMEVVRGGK